MPIPKHLVNNRFQSIIREILEEIDPDNNRSIERARKIADIWSDLNQIEGLCEARLRLNVSKEWHPPAGETPKIFKDFSRDSSDQLSDVVAKIPEFIRAQFDIVVDDWTRQFLYSLIGNGILLWGPGRISELEFNGDSVELKFDTGMFWIIKKPTVSFPACNVRTYTPHKDNSFALDAKQFYLVHQLYEHAKENLNA